MKYRIILNYIKVQISKGLDGSDIDYINERLIRLSVSRTNNDEIKMGISEILDEMKSS